MEKTLGEYKNRNTNLEAINLKLNNQLDSYKERLKKLNNKLGIFEKDDDEYDFGELLTRMFKKIDQLLSENKKIHHENEVLSENNYVLEEGAQKARQNLKKLNNEVLEVKQKLKNSHEELDLYKTEHEFIEKDQRLKSDMEKKYKQKESELNDTKQELENSRLENSKSKIAIQRAGEFFQAFYQEKFPNEKPVNAGQIILDYMYYDPVDQHEEELDS